MSGSVYLFGTPAEESTSGKCNFVKSGTVEKLVDFSMMLHPGPGDGLYVQCLALDSFTVEFFGRQSHAGASPWEGVNALDALMQGFDNVAMLRQQTLTSNRYSNEQGGESIGVVCLNLSLEFTVSSKKAVNL